MTSGDKEKKKNIVSGKKTTDSPTVGGRTVRVNLPPTAH